MKESLQLMTAHVSNLSNFQDIIDLKHIERVPPNEEFLPVGYYELPHHAVFKSSRTAKCRAVFNASAKTSNGNSLNDCLLLGPKQQPDLYSALIRLRFLNVALNGDFPSNLLEVRPVKTLEKWPLTRVIRGCIQLVPCNKSSEILNLQRFHIGVTLCR